MSSHFRIVTTIFIARCIRLFAYGGVAVIFLLYLTEEFPQRDVTLILVGILLGDWASTLFLTSNADNYGRRSVLILAALLFGGLGFVWYVTKNNIGVIVAGIIGIVSPAGGEIGPFTSLEQSMLSDLVEREKDEKKQAGIATSSAVVSNTNLLARYQLFGGLSQAAGALATGFVVENYLQEEKLDTVAESYRFVFLVFAIIGAILSLLYATLPEDVECVKKKIKTSATPASNDPEREVEGLAFLRKLGLKRLSTQKQVALLATLFSLDSFAGGLVIQSYISWWFHRQWDYSTHTLGCILLGINIVAGVSGLAAGKFVARFGAINTMVFTHLPSNILLGLVVAMPTKATAIAMIIARFCISQMDVPARQAYVAMVVPADERSAGNGIVNSIRSIGVAISAVALVPCVSSGSLFWNSAPFVISGVLKCIYDILVYVAFTTAEGKGASKPSAEAASAPKPPTEKSTLLLNSEEA